MLQELFEAIQEQAREAMSPKVFQAPGEPPHRYYLATPDGTTSLLSADPPPRNHQASDLETVARWASAGAGPVAVWYSRAGVVALLNDETRRDRVSLKLTLSPQMKTIMALDVKAPAYDQKAFIRLLRIDLAGCLPSPNLLQAVRTLKFSVLRGVEGEVQHGKESIGRALKAELVGANALPEDVILRLPPWEGVVAAHVEIACAVEIDPVGERPQLIPFPGQVERAVRAAEADLGSQLRELLAEVGASESVSVSYGQP